VVFAGASTVAGPLHAATAIVDNMMHATDRMTQ
jgi:hypothetical protein